jgi:hypothetical protein
MGYEQVGHGEETATRRSGGSRRHYPLAHFVLNGTPAKFLGYVEATLGPLMNRPMVA